jgi:hypothetical protein
MRILDLADLHSMPTACVCSSLPADSGRSSPVSLTFVVSTGRCGSTMVSHLLKQHPEVLSLSEFVYALTSPYETISSIGGEKPWDLNMSGKEFWEPLSDPDPMSTEMINAGIPAPEFIYPSTGRFDIASGVPRICSHVLPLLSNDPDSLYDKLCAEVPTWPRRSTADHCRALFNMLADITGRQVMVERTGGSLLSIQILRHQFPEARFILLHRNGPDCALSMSRHSGYRLDVMHVMAANSVSDIPENASSAEIAAAASEEFNGLLIPPFDKQRFMSYPISVSNFGYLWSYITRSGISMLREFPRNIWTSIKYEELVNAPRIPLTGMASFLGVSAPPQWLDWACDFVDPGRAGSATAQLDPAELAALRASCAPGSRALESIGVR